MSAAIRHEGRSGDRRAARGTRHIRHDPGRDAGRGRRLETSGFDRADLSLPEAIPPAEHATPEAGAKPVDTEEDARQTRTLHIERGRGRGGYGRGRGGHRIGGRRGTAVAAAVLGAGAPAVSPTCSPRASNEGEQMDRERKAASGTLVLSVRAPNAEKRAEAEMILRAAGGTRSRCSDADPKDDESTTRRWRTASRRAIRLPPAASWGLAPSRHDRRRRRGTTRRDQRERRRMIATRPKRHINGRTRRSPGKR